MPVRPKRNSSVQCGNLHKLTLWQISIVSLPLHFQQLELLPEWSKSTKYHFHLVAESDLRDFAYCVPRTLFLSRNNLNPTPPLRSFLKPSFLSIERAFPRSLINCYVIVYITYSHSATAVGSSRAEIRFLFVCCCFKISPPLL